MAVSYVTSVGGNTGTASNVIVSAVIPTGAAGPTVPAAADIAIMTVTNERGTPATIPVDWTTLRSTADGSNMSMVVAWKRLTADDLGDTISPSWGATRRASMAISFFRGAANPVATDGAFATEGSGSNTATGPNITPSGNDAMLVSCFGIVIFSAPLAGRTVTPGGGWTESAEHTTTAAASSNAITHHSYKLLSGQSGVSQTGETITLSANQFYRMPTTVSLVPGGPTGDAGSDQVDIEPYSTVTLTGSGTGTWSQTDGTTVTLDDDGATATFEAPGTIASETLTFDYGGDTCDVTVLPVTERQVLGGVEVPLKTLQVSS